MPFTVSHAAAVLPFRKLNLIWSAFIVGSMAPDFPYVVGTTEYRDIGHHFPGILTFTIPVAVVALWLFHNVIKQPILGMLPAPMQLRLRGQLHEFRFGGVSRFLAILGSIVLGIATHVIWDSFTHSYTWAWYHVHWLRGWTVIPFIGPMPRHSALQYVSSLFGLLALAVWVWFWYRRSPVPPENLHLHPKSRFTLAVAIFVVSGMVGLVRALMEVGTPAVRANADAFFLVFGVTALALAFWQLLLYCVLVSTYQVWIMP